MRRWYGRLAAGLALCTTAFVIPHVVPTGGPLVLLGLVLVLLILVPFLAWIVVSPDRTGNLVRLLEAAARLRASPDPV